MTMTARRLAGFVLALCLGAAGCGGNSCQGNCGGSGGSGSQPTDITLQVDDFISGLEKPWDIAWLPDGTVLVTERPGRLNVYVDGTDTDPVVIPIEDVVARGEGGVMGLEVDPDFATNGYVYVCTTSNAGTETDVRLARLTLNTPNGDSVVGRRTWPDGAV